MFAKYAKSATENQLVTKLAGWLITLFFVFRPGFIKALDIHALRAEIFPLHLFLALVLFAMLS